MRRMAFVYGGRTYSHAPRRAGATNRSRPGCVHLNLWAKTLIIMSATVLLGTTAMFAVAGTVLIEDYKRVEEDAARGDAQRVLDAVANDLLRLGFSAQEVSDVASVIFVGGENADMNQTLPVFLSLFTANQVDAVFARFGDPPQFFGVGFDRHNMSFGEPPAALNASIAQQGLWDPPAGGAMATRATSDIVVAGGRAYLAASYSLLIPPELLPSPEYGSASLMLVRSVDDLYANDLGLRTGEELRIHPWDPASAQAAGLAADTVALDRPDWDHMTIRVRLDDADGQPAFIAALAQDRTVFAQGIDSMTFFFVASLAIAVFFLAVGLLVVRFLVTNRVQHLDARIQAIQEGSDLAARADETGDDEVSRLAQDFNALMDVLQKRRDELEKSNDDLQSFARVVTHDLKSPLSTFALNLRLLRMQADAEGDEKEMERIARMERQVTKMADRIDAILAYSRSRAAALDMGPVPLEPVIADVIQDLAAEIGTSGAELRIESLPTVKGDASQLAQVFQNLLSNAVKFTKPDQSPRVRVWSEPSRTGWAIHVEDQGIGFLPEEVDQLFKPFSRLQNGADREGHGVGLASCARIMERHGGRLHAQGFPGKGARFTMLLRAVDDAPAA